MWERFASVPIRNAGTMGGNVANGSPIGDAMPGLIALGARVVLASRNGSRTLPMEDLYVGYMKKAMAADEVLASIEVPLPRPGLAFRTYKLAKRYDSDISAVCAAFALELDGDRIAACAASSTSAARSSSTSKGRSPTQRRGKMAACISGARRSTPPRCSTSSRTR